MWSYKNNCFTAPPDEWNEHFFTRYGNVELFVENDAIVQNQLRQPGPYSIIHIGDTDATMLSMKKATGEELQLRKNLLYLTGVDQRNIPDLEEFRDIILKSDLVCCQHPNSKYWGITLDALLQWDLLGKRQFLEMHCIYRLAGKGLLFQSLWGKRVVLVGAKAEPFYYHYFTHPHYRAAFPFLGLENIDIVALIPTPDIRFHAMNARKSIESLIRKTYRLKPDIFLFSAGLLAKYGAVMVKEDGYIGIDIGNTLQPMMNWNCKRPFMEAFQQYEHPDLEFVQDKFGIVEMTLPKRSTPTLPALNGCRPVASAQARHRNITGFLCPDTKQIIR